MGSMQFTAANSSNTTSPAYRAGDLTIEVAILRQHIRFKPGLSQA